MNGRWESLKQWLHVPTVFEPKSGPLFSDKTNASEQPDTTGRQPNIQAATPVLDVTVTLPLAVTMTLDLAGAWLFMPKEMHSFIATVLTCLDQRSTSQGNRARDAKSSSVQQEWPGSSGQGGR